MAGSYITVPVNLTDEVTLKRFLSQVLDKTNSQNTKISELTDKLTKLQENYAQLQERVKKLENP